MQLARKPLAWSQEHSTGQVVTSRQHLTFLLFQLWFVLVLVCLQLF